MQDDPVGTLIRSPKPRVLSIPITPSESPSDSASCHLRLCNNATKHHSLPVDRRNSDRKLVETSHGGTRNIPNNFCPDSHRIVELGFDRTPLRLPLLPSRQPLQPLPRSAAQSSHQTTEQGTSNFPSPNATKQTSNCRVLFRFA